MTYYQINPAKAGGFQEMEKRKVTIINKSKFKTKDIEEITLGLLAGQLAPDFYLICQDVFGCKGMALSNLDKPTIIIFIQDLGQFAETFVHELTHIQQHSKNYVNEQEAEEREIVISDKYNSKEVSSHSSQS